VLSAPIDAPTQEHVEESLETHASFTAAEAGAWPHAHAAQLAKIALRCAEVSWVLQPRLPVHKPHGEQPCRHQTGEAAPLTSPIVE
jgi:hypothetical protein